jgi:suppressor for copper-sensitivity B
MLLPLVTQAAQYSTEWRSSLEQEGSQRLIVGEYNADKGQISAALDIKLKDKWHTYWKHPGDAGMSHVIDTSGSENVADVKIIWPTPKRSIAYDMEALAYYNDVVLPLEIKVADGTKPAKLNFKVKWAICDEICLFEEDDYSLELNPGDKNDENLAIIAKAYATTPNSEAAQKLQIISVEHKTGNLLEVKTAASENISENADVIIVEESKSFRFPKSDVTIADDKKSATFTTKYEQQVSSNPLNNKKIEVHFADFPHSVSAQFDVNEIAETTSSLTPTATQPTTQAVSSVEASSENALRETAPAQAPEQPVSILHAILAALLGGLILNIMPCVLPVLSIKIMSVLKLGGGDKKLIRQSFLFTTIGIISSFMVLAALTIAVKASGNLAGWGNQFQHPVFILFLLVVLAIFTANLFGFFEINLNSKLSDKINTKLDKQAVTSKTGSFLTGAFATLMATPCTAPFLVTAVSFALSQGTLEIIYIFFFMGVGLAIPYILVFLSPSLIKIFPKPGRWMGAIKKFMGFLLLLTIFWLIFVMGSLTNLFSASITFVSISVFFWMVWYANKKGISRRRFIMGAAYIFIIASIAPVYFFQPLVKKVEAKEYWKPYSPELVEAEIAKGNTVFIDVTADWCLTCQFNKKRVIYPMLPYLKENKVVGIIADYTSPSLPISKLLEKFKVYGIPFNVVYGPNAPEGITLPVVLTESAVKQAVEQASRK